MAEQPRPDRYTGFANWYIQAYTVLPKFACMLKITESQLIRKSDYDVGSKISSFCNYAVPDTLQGIHLVTTTASDYIIMTLKERMEQLQKKNPDCVYSDTDPYMNVINYFKATQGIDFLNRLTQADDAYLLDNILPWLGLHDWGRYTGGQAGQMDVFKYKLNEYLKQFRSMPAADSSGASGGGKHRHRTQRRGQCKRGQCKRGQCKRGQCKRGQCKRGQCKRTRRH